MNTRRSSPPCPDCQHGGRISKVGCRHPDAHRGRTQEQRQPRAVTAAFLAGYIVGRARRMQ